MNLAPALPVTLDRSHAYCEQVTKTYARNFYYGLRLLPPQKRASMYALYAWMRLVDDIADREDGRPTPARAAELEQWRQDTHAALNGNPEAHFCELPPQSLAVSRTNGSTTAKPQSHAPELWPAFVDMAHRHAVPTKIFDEVIAGQEQDLEPLAFETFDDLAAYCYRVAGVVGLASIYVWGFEGGAETEQLSLDRGIAFQLTNILRDLKEDATRGRLYLPRQELPADIDVNNLRDASVNGQFIDMMRFQIDRAEHYYRQSAPLEARINPDSRPTLVAMTQIYHALLKKIARRPSRVLRQRVSLSVWSKLRIGWKALRARP